MGKLEFNQEIGLHNKFHIIATDVRTGEVTQEAWAYNIILRQGFKKILAGLSQNNYSGSDGRRQAQHRMMRSEDSTWGYNNRYGGYIHLGTGGGVLSPARTELFSFFKGYHGDCHDRGWDPEKMSGHYTLKATIPAGEQYAYPISEVGLASYSSQEFLSTHALLQDSEGEQVFLSPGPYDEVTVFASTYLVLDHSKTNGKVEFINGSGMNFFAAVFVGNAAPSWLSNASLRERFGIALGCSDEDNFDDKEVISQIFTKTLQYNTPLVTFDDSLMKIVFDNIRIAADEGNNDKGIKELGLSWKTSGNELMPGDVWPVFRSALPIPGVWTGKNIENEEVGTGNDQQNAFCTKWMAIVPNSEEIFVQGRSPELQNRGTDYSFNNISVPFGDNIGGYNYGVEEIGGTVTNINNSTDGNTVNYASIGASEMSGNSYTSEPGLIFHYPSINYTDKLRVYQGKTSANSIRAFRFQGSNDLENWTTVVNGELPNSTGWQEFSFAEVGYQYWRFIVDSSWGTDATVRIYELEWLQTRPQIKFTVPPESGAAITANYAVDYIPKDENHVLDISFTFSFKDANAE